MSVASSVADKFSPASATTVLRLAALCLPLAAFVIAVGPPTQPCAAYFPGSGKRLHWSWEPFWSP